MRCFATRSPWLCAACAALFIATGGCSYLHWRREKAQQRSEIKKSPGRLVLERDYAPQDCFGLTGRVDVPKGEKEPLLVAALAHDSGELVGSREIIAETGYYALLLPTGTYDLAFFADLNRDGFYGRARSSAGRLGTLPLRSARRSPPTAFWLPHQTSCSIATGLPLSTRWCV